MKLFSEHIRYRTRRFRASSYVGRLVGGYRITRVVGVGTFGSAFSAVHGEDGGEVLLKLVEMPLDANAEGLLWPEAAALAKCDHPGIPAWLGVARGDAGEYFMVQERMAGESLAYLLGMDRVGGPRRVFSMQEVGLVGGRLIDMLAHAFSRGVLHGDVRPANVLYAPALSLALPPEASSALWPEGDAAGASPAPDRASQPAPVPVQGARVSLVDFGLALFFEPHLADAVFATDAMIDRMGLADTLLFLLYSDSRRVARRRGRASTWENELDLTDAQRQVLFDLFSEECRFAHWGDVRDRFERAFGVPASALPPAEDAAR